MDEVYKLLFIEFDSYEYERYHFSQHYGAFAQNIGINFTVYFIADCSSNFTESGERHYIDKLLYEEVVKSCLYDISDIPQMFMESIIYYNL